ncbi:hypothetical protein KW792_01715, partial [Candidatus Saccharibacteria bacterium]|nr:hypothetical protein [Candidatus Saccharibacteria bacterium]
GIPSGSAPEGIIEGLIKTPEGNIALVHQADLEGPGGHILYLLDSSLRPVKSLVQSDLDSESNYEIKPYGQGFVAYSSDYGQVYKYSSINAASSKMALTAPKNNKLKALSLYVSGNHITIGYSDPQSDPMKASSNEILDYSDSRSTDTAFSGLPIVAASFCGQASLCVRSADKSMSVYNSGGKLLSKLWGIEEMQPMGGQILLALDDKTVLFNVDENTGLPEYTYGSYKFCGLQPIAADAYLLCMKSGNKTVALEIHRSSDDQDSIDKKINQLQKLPQVDTVSIYRNYIYIVPQSASLKYDAAHKITEPDPAAQAAINLKINKEIDTLGINRNAYKIIITG